VRARFSFSSLIGVYRLVVTDALRAFVEEAFVAAALPELHDSVRAEALHEAAGAELEVTTDGHVISRSHGQEFYRVRLNVLETEVDEIRFEKPNGQPVTLVMPDKDTIVAHQPQKPVSEFRRV
jgi:hypothetical protein